MLDGTITILRPTCRAHVVLLFPFLVLHFTGF